MLSHFIWALAGHWVLLGGELSPYSSSSQSWREKRPASIFLRSQLGNYLIFDSSAFQMSILTESLSPIKILQSSLGLTTGKNCLLNYGSKELTAGSKKCVSTRMDVIVDLLIFIFNHIKKILASLLCSSPWLPPSLQIASLGYGKPPWDFVENSLIQVMVILFYNYLFSRVSD